MSELLGFLDTKARPDLRAVALDSVLGLTGGPEGLAALRPFAGEVFSRLVGLLSFPQASAAGTRSETRQDAALALINLSADKEAAESLCGPESSSETKRLIRKIWHWTAVDPESPVADPCAMTLCNLTGHGERHCRAVLEAFDDDAAVLTSAVDALCAVAYNKAGQSLNYLGPLLSNLSQLPEVRASLLGRTSTGLEKLAAFTGFAGSRVRRGGVVGTLRNLAFDFFNSESADGGGGDGGEDDRFRTLAVSLLMPLAGPTPEDADPDEVERLPIDLQYLPEDKQVEEDPDIRKMLLEALLQLCSSRCGREALRSMNCYMILRELHLGEKDLQVKLACENVVDILIKKEAEIGLDDYKGVDVPETVVPQLEAMDDEYLKDSDPHAQ